MALYSIPCYAADSGDGGQINGMYGPFQVGSALYSVGIVIDHAAYNNEAIAVCKSTDGGLAWAEQDAAHHPRMNYGAAAWVQGTVIKIVSDDQYYSDSQIVEFDTASGLWGTPYGSGGPSERIQGGVPRSSSALVAFSQVLFPSPYKVQVFAWDGASWGAPFTLDTSAYNPIPPAVFNWRADLAAGNVDVIYRRNPANNANTHLYHRTIFPDNSLGTSHDLGLVSDASGVYWAQGSGAPVAFLGKLYYAYWTLPMVSAEIKVFVADAATNPSSWSSLTVSASPGFSPINAALATDGVTLYYVACEFATGAFWVSSSTDGITWAPFARLNAGVTGAYAYLQAATVPSGGLSAIACLQNSSTSYNAQQYFVPLISTAPTRRARYYAW